MHEVHERGLGREQLAQAFLDAEIREVVHVAGARHEHGDRGSLIEVRRETERAAIVLRRPIDVGATLDQQLHDLDGTVAGRDVQPACLALIHDVDVHAEIEQQLDEIAPVRSRGHEHDIGVAQVFGMQRGEPPDFGAIEVAARDSERDVVVGRCVARTVTFEQLGHRGVAVQQRLVDRAPLAVRVLRRPASAARERPFGAARMVVRDRDAQDQIEPADRHLFADQHGAPFVRDAASLGMRPKHIEPVRVVVDDRRVVERLRVERIRAALEQELGELVRALVRRLNTLAETDHAGQHLERIVPTVVPRRVRVRAAVEQRARDATERSAPRANADTRGRAAAATRMGRPRATRPRDRRQAGARPRRGCRPRLRSRDRASRPRDVDRGAARRCLGLSL